MTFTSSLDRAGDLFRATVTLVADDDWDRPTPCPEWNVRQLVGHVVAGSEMTAAVIHGANRNEAISILAGDYLGTDPLAALDAALAKQLAAFDAVDDLARTCQHPAGNVTVGQLLGFRVSDLVVHRWDLARALGADETLDAALVGEVWEGIQPMAPIIGQIGVFGEGPSGDVGEDAPLQDRLLDLMGRRP